MTAEPGGSVTIYVLANDSDPNGDGLSIGGYTLGQAAKVEVKNGKLVYTYRPDFAGVDVLTYTAADGHGGEADRDGHDHRAEPRTDPGQTAPTPPPRGVSSHHRRAEESMQKCWSNSYSIRFFPAT